MKLLFLLLFLASHWPDGSRGLDDPACRSRLLLGEPYADIIFPAIFGVHREMSGGCGPIETQSLQQAIALQWATSLLNGAKSSSNASFIPGVNIGMEVYDDCTLPFLTAARAGVLASMVHEVDTCMVNSSQLGPEPLIAGFIGTDYSRSTPILTSTVKSTHMPVLGVSATMSDLSNKDLYPNFIRTVPSDLDQAKVVIQLAKEYSWTYVLAVHSTDNYGLQGMAEVRRLAREERICIHHEVALSPADDLATVVRREMVGRVKGEDDYFGVIFFGHHEQLINVLSVMGNSEWSDLNVNAKFIWIASDGVDANQELESALAKLNQRAAVISPPSIASLQSFQEFYHQFVRNPHGLLGDSWCEALREDMDANFGCDSYSCTPESAQVCTGWTDPEVSGYLLAVVDAVYVLANTVRKMHTVYCSREPGLCPALADKLNSGLLLVTNISSLDYSTLGSEFVPPEFQDRQLVWAGQDLIPTNQALYSIMSNGIGQPFTRIGEYRNDQVTLTGSPLPASECKLTCPECADVDTMQYIYSHGDLVILGLYSIHWDRPGFACGSFRKESASYLVMASFLNSMEWLRREESFNFGYLVIDDCYNPMVANKMLVQILSGELVVQDEDGHTFDPKTAVVMVGAMSSPNTMATVLLLQGLNISMISYSASNANLDNRITYPYFSRTLSSDRIQAVVLKNILQELEVTWVGAIAIKNSYGLELYKLFREVAEAEGICVYDAFEITQDNSQEEIKEKLFEYKNRVIQVIIVIAMDEIITNILRATEETDTFVFIGSEAWGPNLSVLKGDLGERARGSLVLALPEEDIDYGFEDYIQSMSPFTEEADAWLRAYWQEEFECNLPGQFDNSEVEVCQERPDGNYFTQDHIEESMVPMTVHATYATIAAGLATLQVRGQDPNNVYNPGIMTKAIREVELLTRAGRRFRPFLPTGNGQGGFPIYNVQKTGNTYDYILVGNANGAGDVTLDMNKVKFYGDRGQEVPKVESSCQHRAECPVDRCKDHEAGSPSTPSPGSTVPAPHPQGAESSSSTDTTDIALTATCSVLAVLILVALVIGILCCRGYLSWHRKPHDKSRHYATTSAASSPGIVRYEPHPPALPPRGNSGRGCGTIPEVVQGEDLHMSRSSHGDSSEESGGTQVWPPPRPHKPPSLTATHGSTSPPSSASQTTSSPPDSSTSLPQIRYLPFPQADQDETQCKFTEAQINPGQNFYPEPVVYGDILPHADANSRHLSFQNIKNDPPYTISDTGGNQYVLAQFDNPVAYQNFTGPGVAPIRQATNPVLVPLDPGNLARQYPNPTHVFPKFENGVQLAPSTPQFQQIPPEMSQPPSTQPGGLSEDVQPNQPLPDAPPAKHPRNSKYQDDYITTFEAKEIVDSGNHDDPETAIPNEPPASPVDDPATQANHISPLPLHPSSVESPPPGTVGEQGDLKDSKPLANGVSSRRGSPRGYPAIHPGSPASQSGTKRSSMLPSPTVSDIPEVSLESDSLV